MTTPLLIFIHIHKCGGSSLAAVIRRNLHRRAPQLAASQDMALLKPQELVESILRTARRDGYVMGHLGYGTHRIFAGPCRYFTMLREPKARLVSLWRHAVVTPSAYYHQAAWGLSFPAFLAQRRCSSTPSRLERSISRIYSALWPTWNTVWQVSDWWITSTSHFCS